MHVDIRGWVRDFKEEWNAGNKYFAAMGALQDLHNGLFFSLTSRYPLGTNVFERDWELLLVLDGCRVDAVREVAPEYDFITAVDSIWSVGSASHEWICKTYTNNHVEEIRKTMLISTNPFIPKAIRQREFPPSTYSVPLMWADWDVVEEDDFGELWTIHQHDYKSLDLTPPPDFVTEHVIRAGREFDFERTVVHYMHPHIPHGSKAYAEVRPPTDVESDPWTSIRSGAVTREEVWENYLDNLRLVLDSIETLLENFDAEKVVITADHGDLFGEFGAYGHPAGFVHPSLKKVPWVVTSARDNRTVVPEIEIPDEQTDVDVEEQLHALGYK